MDALERGDVDAVVEMLTEDATWSMPPMATWYGGRDAICAASSRRRPLSGEWRWRRIAPARQRPAGVGVYSWDEEAAPTSRSRSTC